MNDTSRQLVEAARDALVLRRFRTIAPDLEKMAAIAVVSTLRELAVMMNDDESDEDWPDAGDLTLLADDVEASL